jgi:hypothetical protein
VLAQARLYIACMKNRDLQLNPYPTSAELYAFERAAKTARAREMVRLASSAVARVKNLFETKGLRHA